MTRLNLGCCLSILALCAVVSASSLEAFNKIEVRDGLKRRVVIVAGNYSVTDGDDLVADVTDGTLTLRANTTALATDQLQLTGITEVVTGLLSGLLTVPAENGAFVESSKRSTSGPITVKLPASALQGVSSESNTVDVVMGNFSEPVLQNVSISQSGSAKLVVLELRADSLDVSNDGAGSVYVMGSFGRVALSTTGPGPVYIGSGTRSERAVLGSVNVTALGLPGSGDIVINPTNSNASIKGTTSGLPIIYSRGTCSVTATAVTIFSAETFSVCTRATVQPPPFNAYWKLVGRNLTAGVGSPAGSPSMAPRGAPMGKMAPGLAPRPSSLLLAPIQVPVPAQAPLPGNALQMSPLTTTTPDIAPAASPATDMVPSEAPALSPTSPSGLQQVQPLDTALTTAATPVQAVGPVSSFFPATQVANGPADALSPAPAVQPQPLKRRLLSP